MTVETHPTTRTYTLVFVALLALLGVTVGLAFVDVDRMLPGRGWAVTLALSIASAKALLIVLIFMHVKGGSARVAMFAVAGFLWLAILATLTFSDYLTRAAPSTLIKGEPRRLTSR